MLKRKDVLSRFRAKHNDEREVRQAQHKITRRHNRSYADVDISSRSKEPSFLVEFRGRQYQLREGLILKNS